MTGRHVQIFARQPNHSQTQTDRDLRDDGMMLNDYEQGAIGPELFRHACMMCLEGLVSKRKDSRYKSGRSPDWIKVKNPASPAMHRAKDA